MREGKKQRGKREAAAAPSSWTGMARGIAAAALTTVFLLGVCAVLIAMAVIPEQGMDGCVLLSCATGTLIGGRMAVRGRGKGGLMWGMCVGMATVMLLGILGFLLYDGLELQRCVTVSGACLCGGGLAGVLGRSGGKKRRT